MFSKVFRDFLLVGIPCTNASCIYDYFVFEKLRNFYQCLQKKLIPKLTCLQNQFFAVAAYFRIFCWQMIIEHLKKRRFLNLSILLQVSVDFSYFILIRYTSYRFTHTYFILIIALTIAFYNALIVPSSLYLF